jgi:hypothetical protein
LASILNRILKNDKGLDLVAYESDSNDHESQYLLVIIPDFQNYSAIEILL